LATGTQAAYQLEGAVATITLDDGKVVMACSGHAIEMLRYRLTPAAYLRALTLAEPFTPATATAAGFLDEVVPAGALADVARDRAAALAALDRDALAATRQRVRAEQVRAVRAAIEADRGGRPRVPVPA
jgi:enoyl-CoA hydratase/carnithine racemase